MNKIVLLIEKSNFFFFLEKLEHFEFIWMLSGFHLLEQVVSVNFRNAPSHPKSVGVNFAIRAHRLKETTTTSTISTTTASAVLQWTPGFLPGTNSVSSSEGANPKCKGTTPARTHPTSSFSLSFLGSTHKFEANKTYKVLDGWLNSVAEGAASKLLRFP